MSSPSHPTGSHLRDGLLEVVSPVLLAHGVDLVELTFQTEGRGWVLRVAIEVPGATDPGYGVTVDLCADVSRDLSAALDVADLISQHYTLEVASPGMDRVLRNAGDYARFAGKLARVHLVAPQADGQVVLRGTIDAVDGDAVRMTVDGKEQTFRVGDVKEARLAIDFGAQKGQKKGSGPKDKKSAKGAEKARGKTAATE